jgi:uncharacterized protein YndB with AHSA1/START domain
MISGDQVRVTVTVDAGVDEAFAIFTEETDLWWRRGPQFRVAGRNPGVIRFEAREGGRLLEEFETPSGPRVFESGRILVWNPPVRLVFEWRGANFAPGERTEVEVTFQAVGDETRVTVEHRGWASLRADHPVRHGQEVADFLRQMGLWWGGLAAAFRLRALERIAKER